MHKCVYDRKKKDDCIHVNMKKIYFILIYKFFYYLVIQVNIKKT